MSFRINHFCSYYSQVAHETVRNRTDEEWAGFRFANAVKTGTCGKGYFFVPEPPSRHRIDGNTAPLCRLIFGRFIASLVKQAPWENIYLVPVPSKDSFDTAEFRSLAMLRASLPGDAKVLLPIVRFNNQLQQAHTGGPRGFDQIYPYLQVQRIPSRRNIILIDDMLTKGGNMLAVRRRLIEAGHDVRAGIVCGRTTWSASDVFSHGHVDVIETATNVPFLGAAA